ncbi:MAG: hypothetical protein H6752_12660 [Candidatus Omnitrophica bacterium]|nr:hypothetical protein [Candidatus Omnitrophota bacterium]
MIRHFIGIAILSLLVSTAPASTETYSFIAVGDIPYSETQTAEFTRSIEQMSEIDARFVIHVGDIKARVQPCEDWLYQERAGLYNRCAHPFVVLVGDNEFNDCPDPIAALELFRKYFTKGNESLGQSRIELERQTSPHYPEHVRWFEEGVAFVGLNVVGSANHRDATDEWEARTQAGISWLEESFAMAKEKASPALVVAFQANPFGGQKGREFSKPFAPIMDTLLNQADSFEGQVLFIHGDSHYFRWDIPFPSIKRKGAMTNLSRLEVFGSPNPHWVEVMVDPESPEVFSIKPHFLKED